MALQGDLNSFALPEVLRLLAGTAKSGRLEVSGGTATGALHLAEGAVTDAQVSNAPKAEGPADVLYEMLRFEQGSFLFDEDQEPADGERHDVEEVIAAAEQLVVEWAEVEQVVPSMAAWITLAAELPGDESVKLSPDRWRLVAGIAGGGTAADVARAHGFSDLVACQEVKSLADDGLVEVRASHTYESPAEVAPVELDDFSAFEQDALDEPPMTDLEDLVVEDRPVVMTEGDDALLPEPLPGEGVAYDGEELVGVVDGFRSEVAPEAELPSVDEATAEEPMSAEPESVAVDATPEATASDDPFAALAAATGSFDDPMTESPLAAALTSEAPAGDVGDADPFSAPTAGESGSETSADPVEPAAELEAPDGADEVDDEERGSLLRFLSTVKP